MENGSSWAEVSPRLTRTLVGGAVWRGWDYELTDECNVVLARSHVGWSGLLKTLDFPDERRWTGKTDLVRQRFAFLDQSGSEIASAPVGHRGEMTIAGMEEPLSFGIESGRGPKRAVLLVKGPHDRDAIRVRWEKASTIHRPHALGYVYDAGYDLGQHLITVASLALHLMSIGWGG
jgi:hypothetical protein